jgi:hypothetical protein
MKNKEWVNISVTYWTTNKDDYKRVLKKINKPLGNNLVSNIQVYIGGTLKLNSKKWWEFWK